MIDIELIGLSFDCCAILICLHEIEILWLGKSYNYSACISGNLKLVQILCLVLNADGIFSNIKTSRPSYSC